MLRRLVLAASLLVPMSSVSATPIHYNIILEVNAVREFDPGIPSDPIYQVGNKYLGFFSVDDAVLQEDGLNQGGELFQFVLAIEDYLWSMNFPSDFSGFRGPPDGLGAPSPGFDVVGGEIVNLRGGVFGSADVPFVDFAPLSFGFGDNTFSAILTAGLGRSRGSIQGSLNVTRIPEPGTLGLLSALLIGLGLARARELESRHSA